MGFLDRKSRVIDFRLTEHGRKKISTGHLDITYFSLSDDGIDYVNMSDGSGGLDIPPMMEAAQIPKRSSSEYSSEFQNIIYTASPSFGELPRILLSSGSEQIELECSQEQNRDEFFRTSLKSDSVDISLIGDHEQGNPGFLLQIMLSGSNEILPMRFDINGNICVDPFLRIKFDEGS